MTCKAQIAVLRSFSEDAARSFYLDYLGFEVEFEHRFSGDAPLYMGLRKDNCALHITEHHGDCTPGSAVRIEVEDIYAFRDALRAKPYRHANPDVTRQDWGLDEMAITDPAGNKLVFFAPFQSV